MTQVTDVLFVHNNFPGQYKFLAKRLSLSDGCRVFAIGSDTAAQQDAIKLQRYSLSSGELETVHPYARRFELECRRAEQVTYASNMLKLSGMAPKVIFVHPGWGEALPLRQLFPNARICAYCEFYYNTSGADVGFDPEFSQFGVDGLTRVNLRNAATLLALADADIGVAPTMWQRSVFPAEFRSKINVIHDGIDTQTLKPGPATFKHPKVGRVLKTGDEVLTFVARNLEPYRGFHTFMRALPAVLKSRPKAQVCIVGGSEVSYGAPPSSGESWKDTLINEIQPLTDLSRVHFLGHLPYDQYVALLRVSRAHAYLTYPFVLSWSLLEALALECAVVASDTAPVREIIQDGHNGLLTPFFEPDALADKLVAILSEPDKFLDIRKQARITVTKHYSFEGSAFPQYRKLISDLISKPSHRAFSGASNDEMSEFEERPVAKLVSAASQK
jgi:glycosyltransferase involved in cell wall biosynthesis